MTDTIVYQGRPAGLGVIITQLSFLLCTQRSIELWVPNSDNLAVAIKRIWRIADDQLTIKIGTNPNAIPNLESDELCTYAPYLSSNIIELYGKEFHVGKRNKPCVALCMHHGTGLGENINPKYMPYNKYASREEYQQIFQRLCDLGYDVIVINRSDITIEQKAYLLNELCEFVIGYEGGLHHLAHCLKIPCIVLPWKYNDTGGDPVYPGMYYETHRFHADRKTYFLNTINDFLEMSDSEIKDLIDQLHLGKGNNILFSPQVTFDPETLRIRCRNPYMDLTPRLCWCESRGEKTVKFIKENLLLENMIKYPVDQ